MSRYVSLKEAELIVLSGHSAAAAAAGGDAVRSEARVSAVHP